MYSSGVFFYSVSTTDSQLCYFNHRQDVHHSTCCSGKSPSTETWPQIIHPWPRASFIKVPYLQQLLLLNHAARKIHKRKNVKMKSYNEKVPHVIHIHTITFAVVLQLIPSKRRNRKRKSLTTPWTNNFYILWICQKITYSNLWLNKEAFWYKHTLCCVMISLKR